MTIERGTWLRPEDINYERPMFYVDPTMPGTDLLGSAAAGMAAAAGGRRPRSWVPRSTDTATQRCEAVA